MKKNTFTSLLLATTVLAFQVCPGFAADTYSTLYDHMKALASGTTTDAYKLKSNTTEDVVSQAGGTEPVFNTAVTWEIDGADATNEIVKGPLAIVLDDASKNASLTLKNIGEMKDKSSLDAITKENAAGYITNQSGSEFAAVVLKNADLDIQSSIFAGANGTGGTDAEYGAAVVVWNDDTNNPTSATVSKSVFVENTTSNNGAALNLDGVAVNVGGSIFAKNTATAGHAGAIDVHGTGTISGNAFYKNEAKEAGAVNVHTGSVLEFSGNAYQNNKATDLGGAFVNKGQTTITQDEYKDNQAKDGGAIANVFSLTSDTGEALAINSKLTLENSDFEGNKATEEGGAIYNSAALVSSGNSFVGNTAENGGALINIDGESTSGVPHGFAKVESTGDTFEGNKATESGGAIDNWAELTIENATFKENEAKSGGAIFNNGGTVTIKNASTTKFSGNTATTKGSAIYNAEGGVVNIQGANDTLDLDYAPYKEDGSSYPANPTRLFADGEDVYNNGTLNIEDSTLQLHQTGSLTKGVINVGGEKNGTVNVDNSRIDLGKAKLYADTVNIMEGSEVLTHVDAKNNTGYGAIVANKVDVAETNTDLTILVKAGEHLEAGEKKVVTILDADNVTGKFDNITENKMYTITALGDGAYELSRPGETPDDPDTPVKPNDPVCPNGGCIHDAWVEEGAMKGHDKAIEIQNTLNEAAQRLGCDSEEYQNALKGVAPDMSPLIQAHSTEITRRLSAIVSKQMYSSMERTGYVHRGKRFYKFPRKQSNLWVQAMFGQSEFDSDKGFDVDTQGIAFGFDGYVSDNSKMGIAYAYTTADGTAVQRDTEITSHTAMVYGEYNPNRFYANWLALYTNSSYEENKKVFSKRIKADYDVDVFSAQIMFGNKMGPFVSNDWATGVISPEVGLRYTYIKQQGYTDEAGQKVGSADGQILTGILGAQYTIGYTLSPTLAWYPEFRAALTYDFIEPDMENSVTLVNGSHYTVKTENLDKFGIEIGARVGLDINKRAELALEYEGLFKGDYTNHTGLASLKYKF